MTVIPLAIGSLAPPVIPSAIAILLIGGLFLYRRADVRLVLVLCALALYVLRASQPASAGHRANVVGALFVDFVSEMTNRRFVVPICCAMGFAYACKQTGCDAHLVHLLCNPLRKVRWLLIPGGVAVAFFVNAAIVSQTSTVSVVGPVLVPLVLAAGFSKKTAGAMLLLGGSMGGELLNPASVEVGATMAALNQHATANGASLVTALDVVRKVLPYDLIASAGALIAFWIIVVVWEHSRANLPAGEACEIIPGVASTSSAALSSEPVESVQEMMINSTIAMNVYEKVTRVNLAKAMVPLIPIFLLIFVKNNVRLPEALTVSRTNEIAEQATIAAAMLIGTGAAAMISLQNSSRVAAAFCEGAAFAYGHVIFVIIAATLFARGIQLNELIERLTATVGHTPRVMAISGVVVPWIMATVTGTAVGSAPAIIKLLVPSAIGSAPAGHEIAAGMNVGTLCSVASQFGRTCSPVAPVTLMCAAISRTRAPELLRRVIPALLVGGVVLLILGLMHQ